MSYFKLKEGDCLLGFSDGALHASSNNIMNFDWDLKDIKEFVAKIYDKKMTANIEKIQKIPLDFFCCIPYPTFYLSFQ